MAAQTFGKVEEFDPKREEWSQCEERLGFYFVANGVEDATKKRDFSHSDRAQNLQVTVKPTSPGEKDLQRICAVAEEPFQPKPSEIVQRFRFNTRFCKTGESVVQYVSELRAIAQHCNFGGILETMLRDQ